MHLATTLIWTISLLSIVCMLLRPRGIAEAYWVCAGAGLLVLLRLLPLQGAAYAVKEGTDVYLFLAGMMILSELAREEAVFEWVAGLAADRAKGSPKTLFLLVYLAGVVVTAFLSNDATAVVLTPAVLAVVKRAKVDPNPCLLSCALVANAGSFLLPISNPANLVIFAHHMPPLGEWLRMFLLPSIASVFITFAVLRWLSVDNLQGSLAEIEVEAGLSAAGKRALFGLLLAAVALVLASTFGLQLGAPTCAAALIAMLIVTSADRRAPLQVIKGVSWSVLPLVAGLFIIVEALQQAGMLALATAGLQRLESVPPIVANLAAGFSVGILSNGMNNLPVGLVSGAALQASHATQGLTKAVLIGVDLGPNLSITGSLATILWLIALRREGVEITAWQFFKAGLVAMPLALVGSLLLSLS